MAMIQIDPQQKQPRLATVAEVNDEIDRVRAKLLDPLPVDSILRDRFALSVLDLLSLRPTDVVGPQLPAALAQSLYEQITVHFLNLVLPPHDELMQMDASHVDELLKALRSDMPEASLLLAAYGTARLRHFQSDRRLCYCSRGYRGRLGDPLADHLYQEVIQLAANTAKLTVNI